MHVQIFFAFVEKNQLCDDGETETRCCFRGFENNFAACCLLASFDLEILKGGDLLNYRLASVHNNTKK